MNDKKSKIPRHVAIIMDGNGRWAKEHGLPRIKGHEAGAKSVRAVIHGCRDLGIEYLTLYAFSVENWVRPKAEIRALMMLLRRFLKKDEQELHDNQVRLRTIGRIQDLPTDVSKELERVKAETRDYKHGNLVLALSYGGRSELVDAVREIAAKVRTGEIDPVDIDEKTLSNHLYASDIPDPDLMIRTSGEVRLSNFLLWQLSYAELYFTDVYWPDFREEDLRQAVEVYAARHRRYGDIE